PSSSRRDEPGRLTARRTRPAHGATNPASSRRDEPGRLTARRTRPAHGATNPAGSRRDEPGRLMARQPRPVQGGTMSPAPDHASAIASDTDAGRSRPIWRNNNPFQTHWISAHSQIG